MVALGHADPATLDATLDPLAWPALPLAGAVAVLVGVLPAWIAPPAPGTPR
jgi:energy-coupling factor transport system permease protein